MALSFVVARKCGKASQHGVSPRQQHRPIDHRIELLHEPRWSTLCSAAQPSMHAAASRLPLGPSDGTGGGHRRLTLFRGRDAPAVECDGWQWLSIRYLGAFGGAIGFALWSYALAKGGISACLQVCFGLCGKTHQVARQATHLQSRRTGPVRPSAGQHGQMRSRLCVKARRPR